MNKIESGINSVWKETLTSEELIAFLRDFQENESDWKISLYKEFQKNSEAFSLSPDEISRENRILASIHSKILSDKTIVEKNTKRRSFSIGFRWAAAASIVILSGIWMLYNTKTEENTTLPDTQNIVHNTVTGKWEINDTHRDIKIITKDSSVITLSPGSSMYVQMDFTDKRVIQLKGKARFDVKKDPQRPFSVEANGITTTALGTVFSVDGKSADHKVNVQLYEGKVMVRSTDLTKKIEALYLKPGEQCFINTIEEKAYVSLIPVKSLPRKVLPVEEPVKIQLPIEEELSFSLQFDKTTLPQVFRRLQFIFNSTIEYSEKDMKEMFFTGTFSSQDSLSQILHVIANMNGLKVVSEGDKFKIINQHIKEEELPPIQNENDEDTSSVRKLIQ